MEFRVFSVSKQNVKKLVSEMFTEIFLSFIISRHKVTQLRNNVRLEKIMLAFKHLVLLVLSC